MTLDVDGRQSEKETIERQEAVNDDDDDDDDVRLWLAPHKMADVWDAEKRDGWPRRHVCRHSAFKGDMQRYITKFMKSGF